MKKIFSILLITLIVLVSSAMMVSPVFAMVSPVFAMGAMQESTITPFAVMVSIFYALAAATGIGSALSLFIQAGKILIPKWFPDDAAQNWRLGTILFLTITIYIGPMIFPQLAEWFVVSRVDQLAKDFSEFGMLLIPLFVAMADFISKKFYKEVLRGSFIGKSYSIMAKASVPIKK